MKIMIMRMRIIMMLDQSVNDVENANYIAIEIDDDDNDNDNASDNGSIN